MAERVYLDWNATAPLRPEARAAMLAAMDIVGNPSSVHAEGRSAKALIERARGQVASAVGCARDEVVFTSSATEAAALALRPDLAVLAVTTEHDCVHAHRRGAGEIPVDGNGLAQLQALPEANTNTDTASVIALQAANSETGVLQAVERGMAALRKRQAPGDLLLTDAVQAVGKVPFAFSWSQADCALVSAHKLGGPKGVGALILRTGIDIPAMLPGGGQEMGRRSGTENVIGIAGFGAAAEAAQRDLEAGAWDRVEKLRNILEEALATSAEDTIFVGKEGARLPNTSCVITPGWKGETQVMQMDLAGFAISAGSACSSGKVKESRVLRAMGFDSLHASSAVRVSLGPTTTEAEVMAFAEAWIAAYGRWKQRAA